MLQGIWTLRNYLLEDNLLMAVKGHPFPKWLTDLLQEIIMHGCKPIDTL